MKSLLARPLTFGTGAPRAALSPRLFALHTNHLTPRHSSVTILKYAHDTAIIGLITDNKEDQYR